jgi:uncharacterized lipoprotein YbaY/heat shock protein HslJ
MKHTIPKGLQPVLLLLTLALATVACREQSMNDVPEPTAENAATITGTVSYRERMALSNQAELEIMLEDVSRQDVPANVLARQTISNPGQVPIRFELSFQPEDIDQRMSYSLRARIQDGGKLAFISDTHTPVLTRGAGREAHLTLVAVQQPAARQETAAEAEPGMELEGMFRYLADAALFRDCRTGESFPVAMESAYIELERAYLNSGIEAGGEVMVRLIGRYLERPSMEGNRNAISLIVDKLENLDPENSCAPTTHAELQNTYWKLVELGNESIETPEGMREAHVILASDGSRAHGHAGCNNFFGTFEVQDDTLTFSALGSTMMACPEGMDTEQAFLEALGKTNRHQISGQFLTLFADDRVLARLEAVYL